MKVILISMIVGMFAQKANIEITQQYYNVEIKGVGSPMILIPGLACPGEVWDETVAEFSKQYQCHVFSLAGFAGASSVDYGASYTQTMADEIIKYIKANKLNKPKIVGHSLGGFIALKIGIQEPTLPQSLVIVDALPFLPAIMMPGATVESSSVIAENFRKSLLAPRGESYKYQQSAMLSTLIVDKEKIDLVLDWSIKSDQKTVGDAMYDLYSTDLRSEIAKIKVPVLVLGAWVAYKQYGVTRALNMERYKSQYSNVENLTVEMTDTGKHFIMWDDPEFFYQQMRAFFVKNR